MTFQFDEERPSGNASNASNNDSSSESTSSSFDCTQKTNLAEELAIQKERLELVLQGTGLGIWDWNPRTGDVVFDQRWCEMLGYSLDEIPANVESWSSRVHPDDLAGCFEDIQAHIQGKTEQYSNTHRMKHRDGHWVYILDRGRVMERDSDGAPIRFTGSHQDVTREVNNARLIDEALQRVTISEQRFRDLTSCMTDWVWEVDQDGRYTFVSDSVSTSLGYSPEEMLGKTPFDFMPPDEASRIADVFGEIIASRAKIHDLVNINLHKNGQRVELLTNGVPVFDDQGRFTGYRGADRDVTEQEKNRAELERAVALLGRQRADQDRVFAIIGHELRTPAAIIDMLLDEISRSRDPSEVIAQIKRQSVHMLSIIDDMKLATDHGYKAETVSVVEQFSVIDVVKQCINSVSALANVEQFTISLSGEKAYPHGHLGSSKAIRQIVTNLLKNAILHSGGDAVRIDLAFEHHSQNTTGFRVSVSDNGRGISPNYKAKMYEAFERGDTQSEGTGLGLYLCRELAQSMKNGSLTYRDARDGGSEFELRFTLSKNVEAIQPNWSVGSTSPLKGKRVILVEDSPMLRRLGAALIKRLGAIVIDVEDGAAALNALTHEEVDLVLTDIMMPNIDGYELTKQLRERSFNKPIIGITGATVGAEAARLLESGADRVLAKPLTSEGLHSALRSLGCT